MKIGFSYIITQLKRIDDSVRSNYLILPLLFILIDLQLPSISHAQTPLETSSITEQLWIDYNPSYKLKERTFLYADFGFRTISPYEWNRFVARASAKYKMKKTIFKHLFYNTELQAGLGFFYTFNLRDENRLEIRPVQGIKLAWPDRELIRITHFVRLEERFDLNTNNWDNTFAIRFRYQAELTLWLSGQYLKFNKGLYIPVSIEFFWNLIGATQFNDAARVIPGIGYKSAKNWRGEVQFGYHYTRDTIESDLATNDFVLRIRVFHTLKRKSSE